MTDITGPILRIALPVPLRRSFDYLPPADYQLDQLVPGVRLRVPFGKTARIGVLLKVVKDSPLAYSELRTAFKFLDDTPVLPIDHLCLLEWASRYYHHPIGEVVFASLPALLRNGRPVRRTWETCWRLTQEGACTEPQSLIYAPPPPLNLAQTTAVAAVCCSLGGFRTFLLEGVTGSGKTEVYLRVIEEVVRADNQALLLVPEIALTAQTISRFRERFNVPLAVFHSGLTDRERLEAWLMARDGTATIVIGTRSAVWTPLPRLGLIIVDEEHDLSYKQQEGFRYSARDVAIMRARRADVPVVLGSATPSLESLHNASICRYQHLCLPERAGTASSPPIRILDLRGTQMHGGLFKPLLEMISTHLQRKEQVLLFLNRRGYAPLILCHQCGWTAGCDRCDAKLTYHQAEGKLRCHHCGAERRLETPCPRCGSPNLLRLGYGTERIVEVLERFFPDRRIVRIDRDTTRRKGAIEALLESIQAGAAEILVGTQMLSKGHHFPKVTLVAIVDADSRLYGVDFRSSERMAQQVMQVAGRAGRADSPGMVVIQTHHPHHPLLADLVAHGYTKFAESALLEREQASLPPFSYLALLRVEAPSRNGPSHFLKEAKEAAMAISSSGVEVFGPVPAPMERRAGRYRSHLLLQALTRERLQRMLTAWVPLIENLKTARKVRWSLDVDPQEIL